MTSTKITHPTYVTKLPSSGKKATYRPFNIKEEKSLLLALQENSIGTVIEAIKNVITACTNGKLDPDKIPYYDTEFLFLQIRSKSIGEVIDMIGPCSCSPEAKTPFQVDIASAIINPPVQKVKTFKIPESPYTVIVRHPSIENFSNTFDVTEDSATHVVADCLEAIYTDTEVCAWSLEEKIEFVESMSPKQQRPIADFLKTMPMVQLPTVYTCCKCGTEHKSFLSGFENFFV
jgi:hypothetical protein